MSTYLVAYANGRFSYLESSYTSPLSGKTKPLRVYSMHILHLSYRQCTAKTNILLTATPDVIGQAQYALDIKAQVLPIYEKLFDIEYPLPKLDTLVVCNEIMSML